MDYFSTTPEDVVILDLDGKVVDGKRKPSSEWALHTTFYKHKPHARAVDGQFRVTLQFVLDLSTNILLLKTVTNIM